MRRSCAYLSNGRGERVCACVDPGLHGLANGLLDAPDFAKVQHGKRQLVALVEQDGVLREEIDLGSYRAPKAERPKPVKGLKVTKGGARWKRLRGAAAYTVAVKLPAGRTVVEQVRKPRLAIRGAKAVAVSAISPSGITGPRTTARRP